MESLMACITQPTYLPWLGYFELIASSYVYVMFDHVQFEPRSWQQRNYVKGPKGRIRLTIPVLSDGRQDVSIVEKRVDNSQDWQNSHLKTLEMCYGRAKYFDDYFPGIEKVLRSKKDFLFEYTEPLIVYFLEALGLNVTVLRSVDVVPEDKGLRKTERLVNLCEKIGAGCFYEGASGEQFIDHTMFALAGKEVRYQVYSHPVYQQLFGEFMPYCGVPDLLFNCGPTSMRVIESGRPA